MILVKEGELATLSVPEHREVAKGTLRSLIRTAGLTVNEFVSAI
ncbi:type II toxin-antitoxin system HicA family toxin [Nostoc sp. CHAB 5784]|nr:type II toxin-antitoxin system HicA family toxin [Nostoc mirabile]MCC5667675.1 type II toxin-antitoxin system HicA family toxin [Nostoc mirabile CHAB5784]